MKVGHLQRFLKDVATLVGGAGGSQKVLADIEKAAGCLDGFADMPVDELAEFLRLADEYRRTGVIAQALAATRKSPRKPSGPRKEKAPKLSGPEGLRTAVERFNVLYDRAGRRELTEEILESELAWFDASLDKTNLIAVAREIGVASNLRTKGDALAAMKSRALSRMETVINTSFA